MIDSFFQLKIKRVVEIPAQWALDRGISPNAVTVMGLALGLTAAVFMYMGLSYWSLGALILSGILDNLDGTMARIEGKGSPAGAFMDIVFDRTVEAAFICAAALRYPFALHSFIFLLASIVLSISVFLAAGALINEEHHKSFYYIPGIIERTETFILLAALVLFPLYVVWIAILGAVLIFVSAVHRFFHTLSYLKKQKSSNN